MDNMRIYNLVAEVPQAAKKEITAGKLKGFTDINPMWRINMLTEIFGPAGIGWYTETANKWTQEGPDGKTAAFVDLSLYVKVDGEWSKPIEGTGGSMVVNTFRGSPDTSDEAFKMAYTDALSVACKALGFGANVYWSNGRSKYSTEPPQKAQEAPKPTESTTKAVKPVESPQAQPQGLKESEVKALRTLASVKGITEQQLCDRYKIKNLSDMTSQQYVSCLRAINNSKGKDDKK